MATAMQPVWSFDSTTIEMWAPTSGWNPQFTGRDRMVCARLYVHAVRRGCGTKEAEALAQQKTWAMRLGVTYAPAAERRLRVVFG
jgi:hypothetical protein